MSRIGARTHRAVVVGGVFAVGGLVLATGVTPASAATTPKTTAKTPGCSSGSLPSAVLGDPKVKALSTEGVYLFHDAKGYEVRVTHADKKKLVVSGTLTASKGFAKLDKVKLEKGDFATETADHKSVVFRFTNFGGVDGFHAYADCSATVKASFKIDGKVAATSQVFLGKGKVSPTSVPFTIDRTKPAPVATPSPSASTTPSPSASASAASNT